MQSPIIELPDDLGTPCVGDTVMLTTSGGQGTPRWVLKSGPTGGGTFTPATGTSTSFFGGSAGTYEVCAIWEEQLPDVGDCAGDPILLSGICPSGLTPTNVQWSVNGVPPSLPLILSPNQIDTYFIAPAPGQYLVQMNCCYYDVPGTNPGTIQPAVLPILPINNTPTTDNNNLFENQMLTCPMAVVGGEVAQFNLYGCEGQTVQWTITPPSGAPYNLTNPTTAQVATALTDVGTLDVLVQCFDPLTGANTGLLACTIPVYANNPDPLITYSYEAFVDVVDVNNCGLTCATATEVITFINCNDQVCSEAYITVKVQDPC